MTYTRPGIYVSEGPFTTTIQNAPAGSAAAFIGTAERGSTTPSLVQSWNAYKTQFGDLTSNYELGYAVYQFFANGGRTAYVTRVVSGASSTANAFSAFSGTMNGASATVSPFYLKATSAGTWGNSLSVVVTAGNTAGSTPTFNLTVKNAGVTVETWSELSLNRDDSRYIEAVVNNYSNYVSAYNVMYNVGASETYPAGTAYTVSASTVTLSGGDDGSAIVASDWATALRTLDSVEGQLTINLVGQSSTTIVNNAIEYVDPDQSENARKNAFLIIDPDPTKTTAQAINALVTGYTKTSYAAVYYSMLSMNNPAVRGSAALRNTYPGGAIAGLYQRVDAERGVGRAPAGYSYTLQNAYGTVLNFTDADISALYGNNVNVLKTVAGAGVIVNGSRTLVNTDITKYIPVRRTLNFVKAQVEEITKPYLFQPNGPRMWTSISGNIAKTLSQLWSSGALKGRNTSEAFFITCDETNNTAQTIEAGEVHVEVGVALQTPAEFIVINVSQFIGGNTISETL